MAAAASEIVEVEQVGSTGGGKAQGLAELVAMGLDVPPCFVVRNAREGDHPDDLDAHYDRIGGGRVAVRSSAEGEDGAEASFAGQFDTVLDVEGSDALRAAIDRCVASAGAERVAGYLQDHDRDGATMHVVVQRMVDARAAGVVFTADPVSGRRDLLVVDAVDGLGEALVSGEATPDHWEVDADGTIVHREVVGETPVLSDDEVAAIARDARRAAETEGQPLDLEWAVDGDGRLWWLQARPITTLPAPLGELDTALPRPDDVLTISNIGEMMPGAVCPLTQSFTGWGIDYGLQHMQVQAGARDRITRDGWQVTAAASGHLFLNLTGNLVLSAGTFTSNAKQTGQTICGRVVPELEDLPPMSARRRLVNTGRMLRYILTAPNVVERFERQLADFEVMPRDTAAGTWREIRGRAWFYEHAMAVHIQSSALSGMCNTLVENLVSEERNESTAAEQAEAARLIAGATGVVSAEMLEELDRLVEDVARAPEVDEGFLDVPADAAAAWLQASASFGPRFKAFLAEHGHRGLRELCVRDPSWGDDPTQLVQSMQAAARARRHAGGAREQSRTQIDWDELGRGMRWILPKAHAAIRRREHTKDMLVDVLHRFQVAFRHLGSCLVAEGALPDADLVFFFTMEELDAFVAAPGSDAAAHAQARREALAYQQRLAFPEVAVGTPRPLRPSTADVVDGALHGRPASRGAVEGVVRVARTLDEAALLQPGEILVTPITDIGWSPYFPLIGGLVTDLGSSVSHGAVVAREYGLPCVVNARQATKVLRTGDRVRLDGDTGTVTLLGRASPEE